jgi:hypothetical protein
MRFKNLFVAETAESMTSETFPRTAKPQVIIVAGPPPFTVKAAGASERTLAALLLSVGYAASLALEKFLIV